MKHRVPARFATSTQQMTDNEVNFRQTALNLQAKHFFEPIPLFCTSFLLFSSCWCCTQPVQVINLVLNASHFRQALQILEKLKATSMLWSTASCFWVYWSFRMLSKAPVESFENMLLSRANFDCQLIAIALEMLQLSFVLEVATWTGVMKLGTWSSFSHYVIQWFALYWVINVAVIYICHEVTITPEHKLEWTVSLLLFIICNARWLYSCLT